MERLQVWAWEPVAVALSVAVTELGVGVRVQGKDVVPVPVLSLLCVGAVRDCVRVSLVLKLWDPVGQLQLLLGVGDGTGLYVAVDDLAGVRDWLQETVTVAEIDAGDGVMV